MPWLPMARGAEYFGIRRSHSTDYRGIRRSLKIVVLAEVAAYADAIRSGKQNRPAGRTLLLPRTIPRRTTVSVEQRCRRLRPCGLTPISEKSKSEGAGPLKSPP